jgi:hypothetical protein
VVTVDDHLALVAVADQFPDLSTDGRAMTTWRFQFRVSRGRDGAEGIDPATASGRRGPPRR